MRRNFVKINDYDPFFVIDDYKIIGFDRVREHQDLIGRRTGARIPNYGIWGPVMFW